MRKKSIYRLLKELKEGAMVRRIELYGRIIFESDERELAEMLTREKDPLKASIEYALAGYYDSNTILKLLIEVKIPPSRIKEARIWLEKIEKEIRKEIDADRRTLLKLVAQNFKNQIRAHSSIPTRRRSK